MYSESPGYDDDPYHEKLYVGGYKKNRYRSEQYSILYCIAHITVHVPVNKNISCKRKIC